MQSDSSSSITWSIVGVGGTADGFPEDLVRQWAVQNGGDVVDTNIDMFYNHVYDFTIVVHPETMTYDATIVDVTDAQNPLSFSQTGLGWRNTALAEAGGYLTFGGRGSNFEDVRAFSLDDVVISQSPAAAIPGDTNHDGIVDAVDAGKLAANWGASVAHGDYANGDFNSDGKVDAADASILAANWGDHRGESAAVPEPSAIILLAFGAAAAALALRRR